MGVSSMVARVFVIAWSLLVYLRVGALLLRYAADHNHSNIAKYTVVLQ